MFAILLFILSIVLIPADALAWGPLTHAYFGSQILYLGPSLPIALYGLIKKYRQDFIYGNIMADMILAKRYAPADSNPHSWRVALALADSAGFDYEMAFCLGYMSHLAADTVAHASYTAGSRNLGHAMLEFRADGVIEPSYWFQAVMTKGKVQKRNDAFMERSLREVIFSMKTNRRIFKGMVMLSGLNNRSLAGERRVALEGLHAESMTRMMDVLNKGRASEVLKQSPMGEIRRGRLLSSILC